MKNNPITDKQSKGRRIIRDCIVVFPKLIVRSVHDSVQGWPMEVYFEKDIEISIQQLKEQLLQRME